MRYLGSKDKLIPAIQSLLSEKGLTRKPCVFLMRFVVQVQLQIV